MDGNLHFVGGQIAVACGWLMRSMPPDDDAERIGRAAARLRDARHRLSHAEGHERGKALEELNAALAEALKAVKNRD